MVLSILDVRSLVSGDRPAVQVPPAITPVAPVAPVAVATGGGSALPAAGNASPPTPVPTTADLAVAVENLNKFLADSQRNLEFRFDKASGRTIITIVNPSTGDVVRQIPSEDVLAAAQRLREAGSLIDTRA